MTGQGTAAGFRLAPQQEVLWETEPGGPAAVVQTALSLTGLVDDERLRDAVQQLVGRHEILRTSFRRHPGMSLPFQVVADDGVFDWRFVLDAEIDGAVPTEVMRGERLRAWDYEQGPMLRAALVQLARDRSILVLTLPALCADETSLALLAGELAMLYGGDEPAVEPLQYADVAEWQAQVLESAEARPVPAPLPVQLPFTHDGPGTSATAFEPARVTVLLPAESIGRLRSVDGPADAADVVLTCLGVTAGRLAGAHEATVGRDLDGRHLDDLRHVLGPLTKVAPVRVTIDDRAFLDVVQAVASATSDLVAQWESLSPEPLGAEPSIVLQWRRQRPAMQADGVVFAEAARSSTAGGYRIKVVVDAGEETSAVELLYDETRIPRDVAERFAHAFAQVLSASLADPEIELGAIDVLPPDERETAATRWNETARPLAYECVHHRFEEQVERTPGSIAAREGATELSYSELNVRANRVAHRLREAGVGRDVVVGLCMDRSVDMVAALLGILKAGGAYLPLHGEHPPQRLVRLLEEAAAPVLVTQERFLDRFDSFRGERLCVDREAGSLLSEESSNPDRVNTGDDRVYVMYTSGSTGKPKGVAVTHRGLANYAAFVVGMLDAERGGPLTFALVSAISTDLGNTCIFPPLVSGGTLQLIDPAASMDGAEVTRIAEAQPYDVLKVTPSHLTALLATGEAALLPRKCLILGGEASTWGLIERVRGLSSCRIVNHYGPTETTVGSCMFELSEDVSAWAPATVPVGRPIANSACYILDSRRRIVPIGVPGELHIGGAGLARGYVDQSDETERRFVRSPFPPYDRLYATGDLARYLPDGVIEFLGRMDAQVKIRGFRVEPAEIEAALVTQGEAREACVVAWDDASGEPRLVGYVVGAAAGHDALRSRIAGILPEYMVPSAFVSLDALPRTPSGKIDRLALPAPEAATTDREYSAPSTPTEEAIAEIWAEVLGVKRVGVRDDFFELGGHSLLATQVVARTRNALGIQVPLNLFFVDPTVAGLAAAVDGAREGAPEQDELARLLDDLESLTDEEAETLLAEELKSRQDRQ